MERTRLGSTDIQVSRVGFGGCPMGGHGWGEVEDGLVQNAIHAAVDRGVNFFDVADVYGLGHSEEILGEVLSPQRSNVVVATKFGVVVGAAGKSSYDSRPAWILKAVDQSLKRLKTDYIDLYQLHYWDGETPFDDIFDCLDRLRELGKIRCFGICNTGFAQLGLEHIRSLTAYSFEFSLAQPKHHSEIALFRERSAASFLSWGTLGQGILSGKYRREGGFGTDDRRSRVEYTNFHGEGFERSMRILKRMESVGLQAGGRSLHEIAIRWVLDSCLGSIALVGMKNPDQVRKNLRALTWSLPEDLILELNAAVY